MFTFDIFQFSHYRCVFLILPSSGQIHLFSKVSVTLTPKDGQCLDYRVIKLCTGDAGAAGEEGQYSDLCLFLLQLSTNHDEFGMSIRRQGEGGYSHSTPALFISASAVAVQLIRICF